MENPLKNTIPQIISENVSNQPIQMDRKQDHHLPSYSQPNKYHMKEMKCGSRIRRKENKIIRPV